ncbi:1836_t:CDS:2 [Entrophospora sp. SA101]|nr:1836_t:CDS:2 [Entrophospora sp. SA101]
MIYIVISVTASDLPDTNTVSSDPATDTVVTGPNTQNPTDTNTKSCDGPVVTTVATDNLSSTSSTGFNFDPSATDTNKPTDPPPPPDTDKPTGNSFKYPPGQEPCEKADDPRCERKSTDPTVVSTSEENEVITEPPKPNKATTQTDPNHKKSTVTQFTTYTTTETSYFPGYTTYTSSTGTNGQLTTYATYIPPSTVVVVKKVTSATIAEIQESSPVSAGYLDLELSVYNLYNSSLEKNKHKTTCPIFQSTLTLPTIDLSSIDTNISEPFPTAKLHEAVNLAVERIDFNLYSSHNKQKITGFLFHVNKQILINLIIKDFIPSFDKSNQDQDHRQILDVHLKSLETPPPLSAVFNYCQATFGTPIFLPS